MFKEQNSVACLCKFLIALGLIAHTTAIMIDGFHDKSTQFLDGSADKPFEDIVTLGGVNVINNDVDASTCKMKLLHSNIIYTCVINYDIVVHEVQNANLPNANILSFVIGEGETIKGPLGGNKASQAMKQCMQQNFNGQQPDFGTMLEKCPITADLLRNDWTCDYSVNEANELKDGGQVIVRTLNLAMFTIPARRRNMLV